MTMNPAPDKNGHRCREVTIKNELGLHARCAAKIVAIARQARHAVWLSTAEGQADATSTMDILGLSCPQGSKLVIRIQSDTDKNTLSAIAQLIENGFGEE